MAPPPRPHRRPHHGRARGRGLFSVPSTVYIEPVETVTIETAPFHYPADEAKLRKMQEGAEADASRPVIRVLAVKLTKGLRPDDWIGMARAIHRWVRDGIRYVHDPNQREELATSEEILERGATSGIPFDDCDGKVRVAVALSRALGMKSFVHPVWKGPVLKHVQWAVEVPGAARYGHTDGKGRLIGELTIKGAELGQDPRTIAPNPETGKLPLV